MNISPAQLDALQEIINIGVGQAASILNEMVQSHIILQVPSIQVLSATAVCDFLQQQLGQQRTATVRQTFNGTCKGMALLLFPTESASNLVAVLTGEAADSPEWDGLKTGTLSEVGNIVINGVMGTVGNILNRRISYNLPTYIEDTVEALLTNEELEGIMVVLAQAHFAIEQLLVKGDLILIFRLDTFGDLLRALNHFNDEWGK
jgi:chemotaxis protein CheC